MTLPPERIVQVLNSPKLMGAFNVDFSSCELVATDADYRSDAGQPFRLEAKDLLLICIGRRETSSQSGRRIA